MGQNDEVCRERKVLPGQRRVTGDIRELVRGQPSLTATAPLDIDPGAASSEYGSAHARDVSARRPSVCVRMSFVFVFSFTFFFLLWSLRGTRRRLRMWSRAAGTTAVVLGQRAVI